MIENVAWLIVATAASVLAAHALFRMLRTEDGALDGVIFVLSHLLVTSCWILAAGLLGGLSPRILGVSGGIVLVALAAFGEHRRIRLPSGWSMGRPAAALAALIAIRMAAQVWLFAPFSGDAEAYHLPKIAEWVRAGRFGREMGADLCATFPAGFELIETWWVVLLHHDVLIELAGVEFAVLAFFSVRALALKLGSSGTSAFLASSLYLLTPTFNLQAVSCLNDAPVAALVLALFAMAAANAGLPLLLLPLGLLAGIKATGLFALPGLILLLALRRKEPRRPSASPRAALGIAAAALLVGAFWYVRNLVWYGNPVYPVGSNLEMVSLNLFHAQTGFRWDSLRSNLSALLTSMIADSAGPPTAVARQTAGWGLVPFSLGAVALMLESTRDRRFGQVAACFGLSAVAVLSMVNPDYWFARFVLFVPAIFCIAAARLAEELRPAAWLLAGAALFQFAATLVPRDLPPSQMAAMMKAPWRERSLESLPAQVAASDSVGVYAMTRTRTYAMYGPDFSRRVVYFRLHDPVELPEAMRKEKIGVVHVNLPLRKRFAFDDLVRNGLLREIGRGYYERVP